jgi:hypothetical protein
MIRILKKQQQEDLTANPEDAKPDPQNGKEDTKVSSNSQSAFQNVSAHSITVGNITQSISQSFKEHPDFFERKDLSLFGSKNFPKNN